VILFWLLFSFWSLVLVFSSFLCFCFFHWTGNYLCCQCTHQGGDWGPERPRIGGWSLLGVMSDWQCSVEWLLAEHYRCRLRLDLRWCSCWAGAKGLTLAGPPRSGETSRLGSIDPVAERDQVRAAWWQEYQDEVEDNSRCKVTAHDRSLYAGFVAVHQKTVGFLGCATKSRLEAWWVETGSGHTEKLRCRGTHDWIAELASGGRGVWRRRGHVLRAAWSFSQPEETSYILL
jgi:hypothetical protein